MSALRHAIRSLAKPPGFTATAIATIALCLGANLAIFAVVDAILVRPFPFHEPERLVSVFNSYPGAGAERSSSSIPNYFERRGAIPALASIALYRDASFIVGDGRAPDRVKAACVSPEFFATLGVPLATGRTFTDAELTYQTDQVAILTDEFWRHQFNADPAILGRTFLNNGQAITVIGLLPPGFRYLARSIEFFRPAAHELKERQVDSRHSNSWHMIARLAPGASITEAQAQIDAFNAQLLATEPFPQLVKDTGFHTTIAPLHANHVGAVRPTLLLLQAGGLALLVIGTINLANLLLIRASTRTKDLAVRQALGARRRHVTAEVLSETTLLTSTGGLFELLLGSLGTDLLRLLGTDNLPLGAQVVFSTRQACIGCLAALLLGLLLAAPIIWYNLRARLAGALQSESRGGTTTRTTLRVRHAFIVAQIAIAFVILSSAGLLGRSLQHILATSSGFSADHVLTGQILLPWPTYPGAAPQLAFAERLLPALRGIPAVTHAALTTGLPFTSSVNDSVVTIEGRAQAPGESMKAHYISHVSGDYWSTLQVPLLHGRLLTDSDSHGPATVCVVDQAFARRYFPGGDPIGRRIARDVEVTDKNAITIVGVVGEVKQSTLTEAAGHGAIYLPLSGHSYFSVLVRAATPPASLAPIVQKTVLGLDPALPIFDLCPMQSRIDDSLVVHRSPAIFAALFSTAALLLAALGTYGVLAYAVSQRRREIGVRIALGAQPRQVLAQFLRLGARLLLAGLLLGLLGSWAAGSMMRSLLYGIAPQDPTILAATTAGVVVSVILALYIPSRRAARTDPLEALRAE